MNKHRTKYYTERDSPFFRLRSKKKLAALLFSSKSKLTTLAQDENLYTEFTKPKKDGGVRVISAPREDLKRIQKRIAVLLQRIMPPEYLFAPVSGRSYVDNAARHLGSDCIHLLDIEDFFPNCSANKIIWFFHKRMQCSEDVASIIKGLVTKNESLPQGSPCSPILAFLSYIDMWQEIEEIVNRAHCTLSVYADDLTISGSVVPQATIWEIKKTLRKHGHHYSSEKERSRYLKPAEVTGVILRPDGRLASPNRQHRAIHELRRQLNECNSDRDVALMQAQLRGRQTQMDQVSSGNRHVE